MSLDRETPPELLAPIRSTEELVEYMAGAEKPASEWKIGTEHEKIAVYARELRPVPYEGERGIGALLQRIVDADGWTPVTEDGLLIGLQKDGASMSLEPGGQLELSGAPLRTIHETCREFTAHLALMKHVCEPFDIVWLGLGLHPIHTIDEIPRMPRARHQIMRDYLPSRASLPLEMMHMTGTVQANFDFADELDMVRKLRVSLSLTPIVSAIYANSSLAGGKAAGFISRRMHIWRNTDPDRTGLLPFVFEPGFGYARYVEYALDVPMFFIVRNGRYLPARGVPFRRFLEDGLDEHRATLIDFERHLTTLFPEVRLKRGVFELRGADAVPPDLTCSLPALWKGILYDAHACEAAAALTAEWSADDRDYALEQVARHGLAAVLCGRPVLELARELAAISREGLRRIRHLGRSGEDERRFLDPVDAQLDRGKSPGEVVLERWEGEWGRSFERLIEYARY
ncbi:MAG: glutamate--cysteine ligase [Deltaproteobacteria bacterium]|nr:MAG: glutamate--cysteine ligase [Deltaproteobacteria bacterium]